jgi:hypothetical protein
MSLQNHVISKYDMAETLTTLFKKKMSARHVLIQSENKFIQVLLHIKMFKPLLYTVNTVVL